MNSDRIYDEIIKNASSQNRRKVKGGTYYERHHITPKCLGGGNEKSNLVLLTAREHFVCHKLLVEIYPKENGLIYALHRMMFSNNEFSKRNYKISSRDYERFRQIHSLSLLKEGNPNWGNHLDDETKDKIRKANLGKKLSKEHKMSISERSKGEKNPMFGSKRYKEKNPFYGKTHSEETKRKMSEKISSRPKITCSYCGVTMDARNFERWHGYNCKQNPNINPSSLEDRAKTGKSLSERTKNRVVGEEELKKRSERMSGENNPFFGKKHTPESIEKITKAAQNRKKTMFQN